MDAAAVGDRLPPTGLSPATPGYPTPEQPVRVPGGAALRFAEKEARRDGHSAMSLITTIVNPARRLYERQGFRVVETRTDPDYERYTGIPGRVLMVKELA